MELFLRKYAARSILTHLNAPEMSNFLFNGLYTSSNTNNHNSDHHHNNYNDTTDNSNLLVLAQQQPRHLLNDSAFLQDAISSSNDTATIFKLASLAANAVVSTLESINGTATAAADGFYYPLVGSESYNDSLSDGYMNFSCDGESVAISNSSAGSDGGDGDQESALSSVYFKTTVYLLYIPIFVFALLGNGTVCYIVQSTPRMRTVTNFFIANLAVGDILMSLFCVPFSFVSIFILGYWPFGIALCYLVNYSQAVSVLVSAYTLVAISIDRYIAIMWPLRPRITKRYAKFLIAGVWGIALVTAFPIPIVSKLTQPDIWHVQCHRYICREEWPSNEQYYYYTLALFTLQFVVPLAVLIFTYTRIALAVWGKRPPGEAENSRDQRMARSKRKMIKMMVTVVIVFTICWLPFNILVLLLNDEEFKMWPPLPYFWFAFHWLAMSHSCYNPIIYCYMNARFRGGFLQIIYRVPLLRRCCCLRRYLRTRGDRSYEATGTDDAFHLQRVNTCTTYISTRRKLRANSMQVSQFSCAETTVLR